MKKSPGEKLGERTPKYVIESDATIVAPLMFAKNPRLVIFRQN